jgi:ATP-binding cassette subfamily B protein
LPLVAAMVLATAVAGALPVALLVAGGVLSERIAQALAAGGSSEAVAPVLRAFVLLMGLFLAGEVMVPVQSRLRWLVMKHVDGAARDRVMAATLRGTDMTRLHDPEYLEAMRRTGGLVRYSATPGSGAAGVIGVARDYVTGIGAAAVLATFHLGLAALLLGVALVVRVRWRAEIIAIVDVWIEGVPSFREAHYFAELGLGRTAADEIRLFGLRDWLTQRIRSAGVRGWTPTWRQRMQSMRRVTTLHLVLTGVVGLVALLWAAEATIARELSIGELVVFVPAVFAVLALGRSFDDDLAVEYGNFTLDALETLERMAAETEARERGVVVPSRDAPPTVTLRAVSFRYPGAEDDALRGVDLEIPSGTAAALVGLNGAGKTTLVRLLCGLYPPSRGQVLVDGLDLREVDLEEWHRRIAPMFQEFTRLHVSVAENVAVGRVESIDRREAVRAALADAGALGFVESLPEGVGSLLSTRYADGRDLSGGQWQRVGIARALFALGAGARFLILDEPTSNLDTASEERLVRRLLDDTRGSATTLLVTHRLALARRTDRIFVVERGRVVEAGGHDDLVALGGRYATAFSLQASLYPLEEPERE